MNPRAYRSQPKKTVAMQTKKPRTSEARSKSLQFLVLAIGLVLIGRLFYLQVVKHGHYNNLAIAEHQKKFTVPATRGSLYFRDGEQVVPAVINSSVYTLYADPGEIKNPQESAKYISQKLSLPESELLDKLKKENTSYVVLTKRLSRAQVDDLLSEKEKLRGINVTSVPQRVYPEGILGSQLLGFVNDEGVGQYGLEGAINEKLEGTAGTLKAITDVRGVPLSLDDSTNIDQEPQDGKSYVLTIDRNVQAKAEEALAEGLKKTGATRGSVIVVDPNTGAVRAMANQPTFDPARYFEVGDDAYERFRNRVVSDPYEAGSVIKVLTMAAGINDGVVTKDSRFNNTGSVQVDDANIRNVEQTVNGSRSMTDVFKYSLNTGVVHVLSQLGGGSINAQARDKLYNYFTEHYGFGQLTGIEQSGEVTGSIYGPRTEQGNNVRYANMSFGQGMNVSMVQVASAFSALVNGGNYYQPHILEGERAVDGSLQSQPPQPTRNVVSEATSAQIKEMTHSALQETPAVARFVKPGYRIGGKTGTSQTIDPKTGKYTDQNAIGTYLGYGGDSTPRYVIMVRVDDSKLSGYSGSEAAAPIFGEISNWLLEYYNVKPE